MGSKTSKLTDEEQKWVEEQEDLHNVGMKIIQEAVEEALDYFNDAVENLDDRAWRKMTVATQAVETGVGEGLGEYVLPVVYARMKKDMHKKLKIPKERAEMLRFIFMGRVVKNIVKAINERDTK